MNDCNESNQYIDSEVEAGVSYAYQVAALYPEGPGPRSDPASATAT